MPVMLRLIALFLIGYSLYQAPFYLEAARVGAVSGLELLIRIVVIAICALALFKTASKIATMRKKTNDIEVFR